jgi:hypothetical protein
MSEWVSIRLDFEAGRLGGFSVTDKRRDLHIDELKLNSRNF